MESDAYRLGALIGRLLVLLVPVVVGVVLAIRWHRRGRRLGWLWGLLIALGGLVLFLTALFLASGARITAELTPSDVLVAPPGHRLRTAPSLQSQTESQLRADPDVADHLRSVAVREIVDDEAEAVGAVTVIALDPIVAGRPGQEGSFVRGLESQAGVEPTSETLEGESVSTFVVPPTETLRRIYLIAWQHENLFISISTADEATVRAAAASMIRRQGTLS